MFGNALALLGTAFAVVDAVWKADEGGGEVVRVAEVGGPDADGVDEIWGPVERVGSGEMVGDGVLEVLVH